MTVTGHIMNDRQPTTIASYVYAIIDALEESGLDGVGVVRPVLGGSLPRNDPTERISPVTVAKLFKAAVEVTGDEFIGLMVGKYIHRKYMHALGNALLASSSLREFCLRLQRYFRLLSLSGTFEIRERGDQVDVVIKVTSDDVCLETQDALTVSLVNLMREMVSSHFNPTSVSLRRPEPQSGTQRYEDVFRCPLFFSSPDVIITVPVETYERPLPAASHEIAFQNDQIILSYLAKLDRNDVETRVRIAITRQLASGHVTKEDIAGELNMSPRTMQNRLAAAGTSFRELLDDLRKTLAIQYLQERDPSITEITYSLGFSDTSNFTRAFKRWMNCSPTEYREQLR